MNNLSSEVQYTMKHVIIIISTVIEYTAYILFRHLYAYFLRKIYKNTKVLIVYIEYEKEKPFNNI